MSLRRPSRSEARALIAALGLLIVAPSPASADAIEGFAPPFCPPGYHPYNDHYGSGCRREVPRDCPRGYAAGVVNDVAYCQPPPAIACPPGSIEGDRGPDRPACDLMPSCETDADCWGGTSCQPASLCVSGSLLGDGNADPRMGWPDVHGTCGADGACASGGSCDRRRRCTPNVRHLDPEGRTRPAIIRERPPAFYGCVLAMMGALLGPPFLGFWLWRRRRGGSSRPESESESESE